MTQSVTVSGKSVEEAVAQALTQLQASENQVNVTVLAEAKKGVFGFGKQDAVVLVSLKEAVYEEEAVSPVEQEEVVQEVQAESKLESNLESAPEEVELDEVGEELFSNRDEAIEKTAHYLIEVARAYGADATVTVEEFEDQIIFNIESQQQGLLIGKYGKILNALQTLAQVLVHRYVSERVSVVVDIADYRRRRSEMLKQIAEKTAARVLRTKQPVYLEPLPSYERKQIHAYLSKNKRISTHSEGKEPHRYLVVELAE